MTDQSRIYSRQCEPVFSLLARVRSSVLCVVDNRLIIDY